ncbi:gp362 [Bacillus phage G]|uniref:Gp362 n=1 Tax=Bacillus phage G TaxID=2884420 RepID=G3MAA3_9CAUD|nr:gp362 [Bacillus phage G]AEO93621.1 gp362 [Bacillus phage G]
MFSGDIRFSPVNQDFIWMAEYVNGSYYSEFDFSTKKENQFYNIKRNELIRFGLVGCGLKLYYEAIGGVFKLNGQMIELIYEVDGKEYYLTGNQKYYNDIISYKDAHSFLSFDREGEVKSNINQYNFGYKVNLNYDDLEFNFKALCKIPFNKPVYLNFRLVANKDLEGFFVIKRNGHVVDKFQAPLQKNVSGELNWQL